MNDLPQHPVGLPMPTGCDVLRLIPQLRKSLAGESAPIIPVPANDPQRARLLLDTFLPGGPAPEGTAIIASTSGTTGIPKGAQLSAAALCTSGISTAHRLGGHGRWILALPAYHIAGIQVLLRSILAGTEPICLDLSRGFSIRDFADAAERILTEATSSDSRFYTSLVPSQVHKIFTEANLPGDLGTGGRRAVQALTRFSAVLVGGASLSHSLLDTATRHGINVITTYGSSETGGGCVYDGRPLDESIVRVDTRGRIWLGGATLATGYRNLPHHPAWGQHGWFRTDDLGGFLRYGQSVPPTLTPLIGSDDITSVTNRTHEVELCPSTHYTHGQPIIRDYTLSRGASADIRLTVQGRLDEAINTGGLTIVPQVVESALTTIAGVSDCAVVGLPDSRLGEMVTAAIVWNSDKAGSDTSISDRPDRHIMTHQQIMDECRQAIRQAGLSLTAAPRQVVLVDALPLLPSGKVDRRSLRTLLLSEHVADSND